MFDITATGKRLAKFRRDANYTQMEVAEKLGISFQAVRYWECGKTMPDISNLIRISELYNVSIDAILDNEKQAKTILCLSKNHKSPDLLEIISILKPSEINAAIENSQINAESFQQIFESAPYLEENILSSLAMKYSHLIEEFSQVCLIACYINMEALDKIALDNSGLVKTFWQICELACRMSKAAVSKLVSEHLDLPKNFKEIENIVFYLEKSVANKLVLYNMKKIEQFSTVCNLACYLSKDVLSRIAEENAEKVDDFEQVSNLACQLLTSALSKLAFANVGKSISEFELGNICFYLPAEDSEKFKELQKNSVVPEKAI